MELVNNDYLLEDIVSYAVAAGEILEKQTFSLYPKKENYRLALIPKGPDLYTGMLKAGGYLLLDKDSPILIYLYHQTKDPKTVLFHNHEPISILGTEISIAKMKKGPKQTDEPLPEFILEHLRYARVISHTKEIICLGVGNQISKAEKESLYDFCINIEGASIVCITDLHQNYPEKEIRQLDHDLLVNMSKKPTKEKEFPIVHLFYTLCKKANRQVDMIGYSTSELGISSSQPVSGYACLAA